MNVWNLEQVNYFFNHSKGYRYYAAYLFAILTVMGKSGIPGLCWRDMDSENRVVYVK